MKQSTLSYSFSLLRLTYDKSANLVKKKFDVDVVSEIKGLKFLGSDDETLLFDYGGKKVEFRLGYWRSDITSNQKSGVYNFRPIDG